MHRADAFLQSVLPVWWLRTRGAQKCASEKPKNFHLNLEKKRLRLLAPLLLLCVIIPRSKERSEEYGSKLSRAVKVAGSVPIKMLYRELMKVPLLRTWTITRSATQRLQFTVWSDLWLNWKAMTKHLNAAVRGLKDTHHDSLLINKLEEAIGLILLWFQAATISEWWEWRKRNSMLLNEGGWITVGIPIKKTESLSWATPTKQRKPSDDTRVKHGFRQVHTGGNLLN